VALIATCWGWGKKGGGRDLEQVAPLRTPVPADNVEIYIRINL